jgi:RNA-directed DNA polymerase
MESFSCLKMKRANNLIPLIADIDNLRYAFWKASKGKRHSTDVMAYQTNLDSNLLNLQEQILSGAIEVGRYHSFKIYEPKERLICASAFGEQVLHHALMNICHPYFEKVQIFDSYASRKDKGTHKAIERAQLFSQHYKTFLKLDVRKFFDSIDHKIVKAQLACIFKEPLLLHIFSQIIDSYEAISGKGVPIGNLTSQYFSNHYLAYLDHFIKEELGCKGYVRYMDDMLLFHEDKEILKTWQKAIANYLDAQLHNQLKPTLLNYTDRGIPFLGYRIFPAYMRLLHKSKIRFIRKWRKLEQEIETEKINQAGYQRKILPLLAFISHTKHKYFEKSVFLHL